MFSEMMMRYSKRWIWAWMAVVMTAAAHADFEITWYTIDGGGGVSTSASYSLSGTIGQPDAGRMSAGPYVQSGGYWPGSYGCVVNLTDLALFCGQWLETGGGLPADLDGSGQVDLVDFAELAHWWYDACPADWPIK